MSRSLHTQESQTPAFDCGQAVEKMRSSATLLLRARGLDAGSSLVNASRLEEAAFSIESWSCGWWGLETIIALDVLMRYAV